MRHDARGDDDSQRVCRVTASERILTVAVIGCGRIAGGLAQDANVTGDALSHAAAYDRHQGFRTVACVEPDEARRRGFMDRWGVEHGFATIEEATDSLGFDVASVCTPTDRHETDLWRLLDTPVRAVWCEKPLTGSFQRSARIVEAYRGADKALAVNHLRRWHPAMRDLRAEIAADKWGAVRSVVGFYTKGIRNNGSHMIDLVQFLIGPLSVRAVATARIDYDAADPTVDAILTTQAGVPVHLVGGDARDYALFEVEIVAAGGSIRIERSGRSPRSIASAMRKRARSRRSSAAAFCRDLLAPTGPSSTAVRW